MDSSYQAALIFLKTLDFGLRRNDKTRPKMTFCEDINVANENEP